MINRLIKNFTFNAAIRSSLVFSDTNKIRLNTEGGDNASKVQLKLQSNGRYPLATGLFVETALLRPNALQQWQGFEAIVAVDPATLLLPAAFSIGFKLKTTAGNYWWTGSAWTIAGAGDWSTEQEINDNIATFPISTIGNKGIGVVINLVTTDDNLTPELLEIKLLGEFDIEFFEDLVYDTIIRKLNTEFRSSATIVFPSTGGSSVNLNVLLENKGYNVTGIKKVIDLTNDPLRLANLFQSYTPGAARQDGFTNDPGVVVFSQVIVNGNLTQITFEYVPEIMVNTGVDYFEVPKFPSLVFENIEEIDIRGFKIKDTNSRERDFIRDKIALTAVLEISPEQRDYRFNYAVFTGSQEDQMRLPEDLKRFLAQNKVVKSWGLDQDYDVNITAEFTTKGNQKSNNVTDQNVASGSFDILGVLFFQRPSEDVPLIGPGQAHFDVQPQ